MAAYRTLVEGRPTFSAAETAVSWKTSFLRTLLLYTIKKNFPNAEIYSRTANNESHCDFFSLLHCSKDKTVCYSIHIASSIHCPLALRSRWKFGRAYGTKDEARQSANLQ